MSTTASRNLARGDAAATSRGVEIRTSLRHHRSPAIAAQWCPKSTSRNQPCHRVLRRSPQWNLLGYAQHLHAPSSRSTPSPRPGAYRVFTETASGARTDRLNSSWTPPRRHPGRLETGPPRPIASDLVDVITGLAELGIGFRSLQISIDTTTPGGKLVFHVFTTLGSSNATSSATTPARCRQVPRPPRRPTLGHDHKLQVAGGDVCVQAVLGGGNRQDPRGQPHFDLPPPHPRRWLINSPPCLSSGLCGVNARSSGFASQVNGCETAADLGSLSPAVLGYPPGSASPPPQCGPPGESRSSWSRQHSHSVQSSCSIRRPEWTWYWHDPGPGSADRGAAGAMAYSASTWPPSARRRSTSSPTPRGWHQDLEPHAAGTPAPA